MNKRQLEVQKMFLEREAEIISLLKKIYARASRDCAAKISDLSARTDMENLKSIIWQKQYQQALKKQIGGILNKLNTESFETVADYLTECYENGFFGTMYDLQGQGIPLLFPINQEEAAMAIQVDSKISKGLYQRMGEDVNQLKDSIRSELSRGIANGSSWNMIAKNIAFGMRSPYMKAFNRAIGIARTEGHRIQQEATLHCQQRAKSRGADVLKQWDSTMDNLTRPHHRELDGQVREIEEPFEVAGKKAMFPGGFGDPSEDCNCRCCLVQTGKWELSEEKYYTKWDGEKDRLVRVKAKTYNEFKEKAKTHLMKIQFPDDVYKINGFTPKIKDELETALLKLKSEYDIRLNAIFVEKAGKNDIFITGYHDGVMEMVVNQDADFNKIVKQIPLRYVMGRFAGKSLEDYLAHEMAHVMLYQDCKSDLEYIAKDRQVEQLYDALKGISGYADESQSGNEALAEAFVRVRNGEDIPPIVKVIVESYFARYRR